jgi:hypothetical protein
MGEYRQTSMDMGGQKLPNKKIIPNIMKFVRHLLKLMYLWDHLIPYYPLSKMKTSRIKNRLRP